MKVFEVLVKRQRSEARPGSGHQSLSSSLEMAEASKQPGGVRTEEEIAGWRWQMLLRNNVGW